MILQALYDYQKRQEAGGSGMKFGCGEVELKFLIEIDEQGAFQHLVDLRQDKKGKTYILPKAEIRSGKKAYEKPCLLWDSIDFVLGQTKPGAGKDTQTLELKLQNFTKRVRETEAGATTPEARRALRAVVAFYDRHENEKVVQDPHWKNCLDIPGCKMSFMISGDVEPVAALPEVCEAAGRKTDNEGTRRGRCLITGKTAPLAILHPQTPIPGGQATGKLVSFQKNSGFDSYFKEQGDNAPVSEEAAFAYGTALNTLIRSQQNSYRLAGDTYVFWSAPRDKQKKEEDGNTPLNLLLRQMMAGLPKDEADDPNAGVHKTRAFFDSLRRGIRCADEDGTFYLLGLSPNAGRISVRLWKTGTVKEFKANLQRHIEDFHLKNSRREDLDFSIYQILRSLTLDGKVDSLPAPLAGSLLDRVVSGAPYPMTLYQRAIGRIRATRKVYDENAAVVKGALNRWSRRGLYHLGEVEYKVTLDTENTNKGYVLGRLFAVIEKIQADALPGLNSTIGERYYGAASSTPAVAFPRLLRMISYYRDKLSPGSKIHYDRLIQDIMAQLGTQMPIRLSLIEQGSFAIGYYHQKQALYTKKDAGTGAANE